MRYSVTVDVPYLKKLPYTIFSKGSVIEIPHIDKNQDYVHFKYAGGTVFVVFYTFKKPAPQKEYRRAYIVTCWESETDGESITLPGIDEKLCLIYMARGRKVDDLRRVLYVLTEEQGDEHKVFKLPLLFWYRLGALIQQSGAARSDVTVLWERFTHKKLLKLSKKESQKLRKAV